MTSGKKIRNLIYTLAVAFIALLAGVFLLFLPKSSLRASANELFENETHTTDALYFTNGAAADLDYSGLNRLRFYLNVNSAAFKTTNDKLIISFDETLHDGIFGVEFVNESAVYNYVYSRTENAKTDNVATIAFNDIPWVDNQQARLHITLNVPLSATVRLKATPYDGTEEYNTCYSAERSLYYVWNAVVEDDTDDGEIRQPYIAEYVDFVGEGKTEELRMNDYMTLTADRGVRLMVNVPTDLQEQINAGVNVYNDNYLFYEGGSSYVEHHSAKMLVVTRAETTDAFTDMTSNVLKEGEGFENYYYGAPDLAWLVDGENFQTFPNFYGKTYNEFFIPLPEQENYEKEYVYYVQVVEVERKWQKNVIFVFPFASELAPVRTVFKSSTYFTCSMKNKAIEILSVETSLDSTENAFLRDMAGIERDLSTFTVNVQYKKATMENGLTVNRTIEDETFQFLAQTGRIFNKELVLSSLYNTTDFDSLSDFNVTYTSYYANGDTVYKTGSRIVLQAKGYDYVYDVDSSVGTLTVLYHDFQYKDLALRLTNNDPTNHLIMDCYTAEASESSGRTTVTYNYDEIQTQMLNTVGWLFDLSGEQVAWNTQTTSQYADVDVQAGAESLSVSFPTNEDYKLMNLQLTSTAEIVEDSDVTVTLKYKSLAVDENGDIVESWEEETATMLYSKAQNAYEWVNLQTTHGELINGALELPNLDITGDYMLATGCQQTNSGEGWLEYTVTYKYNTLFKVTHTTDGVAQKDFLRYVALDKDTLEYKGADVLRSSDIPSGYRAEKITTTEEGKKYVDIVIDDTKTYEEWVLLAKVQGEKRVIPLTVNFTGGYNLVVNYFETYTSPYTRELSPFAVKKVVKTSISVKDYPTTADVYALTATDIQGILGLSSLQVCGMVIPDEDVDVVYDNVSTYTATLSYGFASIAQIDYDGHKNEIQVPLIPYEEWCAEFGQNWSILFLNNTEHKYFKYSNEIERKDLYGFFSVAVFEEQVTDFNYYFKNNTGDGNMVMFESKQVEGSALYQAFESLRGRNPVFDLVGNMGMFLCEVFNDENKVYHNYFFYLDGSVEQAFISNGGADNADDTDGAGENFVQDVGDWFVGLGENSIVKLLGAVVGLALLVVFGFAVYKLLVFLKLVTPPGTSDGEEDGKNKDKGKKDNKNGK